MRDAVLARGFVRSASQDAGRTIRRGRRSRDSDASGGALDRRSAADEPGEQDEEDEGDLYRDRRSLLVHGFFAVADRRGYSQPGGSASARFAII